MQFEVGKIINYDNNVGEILAYNREKYLFINEDLQEEYNCLMDKVVIFRPEKINDQNRAFYIHNIENILINKKERKKILQKLNNFLNN